MHCPFYDTDDCTKQFKYTRAFTNHVRLKHTKSEDDAEKIVESVMIEEVKKKILGGQKGKVVLAFYDLETTGLITSDAPYPRIAEIAVKFVETETLFTSLVNPEIPMPESAYKIHKLSDDLLEVAPKFELVSMELVATVKRLACPDDVVVFVAHNGEKFDKRVLRSEFKRCGLTIPTNWRLCDSLPIFKSMVPKWMLQITKSSYSLD